MKKSKKEKENESKLSKYDHNSFQPTMQQSMMPQPPTIIYQMSPNSGGLIQQMPYNQYTSPQISHSKLTNTYKDIKEFIESLGPDFVEYKQNFVDNGYSVDLLPYLTNDQLKDIGILKVGHRLRILITLGINSNK